MSPSRTAVEATTQQGESHPSSWIHNQDFAEHLPSTRAIVPSENVAA
jgi:hypothetical protein